eukprot:SAG22_NODE_237_length_14221_cov_37.207832_10_plen_92_part_00
MDNDDGSLFWRVTSNFMAFGWCQKFKCGGIESTDNVKLMVELGGKFDAGAPIVYNTRSARSCRGSGNHCDLLLRCTPSQSSGSSPLAAHVS